MSENNLRGNRFEYVVKEKLQSVFSDVRCNVEIKGYSGSSWHVDFLVDNKLIVECTLQKRMDVKINSVFLKFTDISKVKPDYKCGLVISHFYPTVNGKRRKRCYSSSSILTMTSHGYPIIVADDVHKLNDFLSGTCSAQELLNTPFQLKRKLLNEKYCLVRTILEKRAMSIKQISNDTGLSMGETETAVRRLIADKKIVKLGVDYCADYDKLVIHRLTKRCRSHNKYNIEVNKWLESKILDYLKTNRRLRTSTLAKSLGLSSWVVGYAIKRLHEDGFIKSIGKGEYSTWILTDESRQIALV